MNIDYSSLLSFDFSDEEADPNNPLSDPDELSDDEEDGSTASNGAEPLASTALLQQEKQHCCNLMHSSIKAGDLYETPQTLLGAFVEVSKQFHFSVRR